LIRHQGQGCEESDLYPWSQKMIRITPGSPAAALVASIKAQRQDSQPSRYVRPTKGLTTELPARFRSPIIMRQARRTECCEGLSLGR
jgi:hypothetical protein